MMDSRPGSNGDTVIDWHRHCSEPQRPKEYKITYAHNVLPPNGPIAMDNAFE